jgi:hypothetical protein
MLPSTWLHQCSKIGIAIIITVTDHLIALSSTRRSYVERRRYEDEWYGARCAALWCANCKLHINYYGVPGTGICRTHETLIIVSSLWEHSVRSDSGFLFSVRSGVEVHLCRRLLYFYVAGQSSGVSDLPFISTVMSWLMSCQYILIAIGSIRACPLVVLFVGHIGILPWFLRFWHQNHTTHRLVVIDIFSVCHWIFWNILEEMAMLGVRSVPKKWNSATTLKISPAKFVHTSAIRCIGVLSAPYFDDRSKNLRTTTGPRPYSSQN